MLTALDRGVPDRLPASVHGWMRYWLEKHLDGASDMEAFDRFGLDWSIYTWKWIASEEDLRHWEVEKEERVDNGRRVEKMRIVTPEGTLTQTRMWDEYYSPWVTEYLLKEPEDVFVYAKYHPRQILDLDFERMTLGKIGDRGILRGGWVGPWHRLCDLYGVEKMIFACFESPEWVHDAMNAITESDLRHFESLRESKTDLFETGGGHNSSTVISPDIFREFILPYEKTIHGFLNAIGIKTVYHTCGGMMPILDHLVEIGSTALETLTPPALGGDVDLADAKRRVGDKVALIGGFDQFNGFENASPDETREYVRKCFAEGGVGGGYIMNPSDHFYECPVENMVAYADEACKCLY